MAPKKKSEAKPSGTFWCAQWGFFVYQMIPQSLQKFMLFFREVKQDKRVAVRTTKVSHYSVFTIFWLIMVSSPYQFSFTVVAIHVKKVG